MSFIEHILLKVSIRVLFLDNFLLLPIYFFKQLRILALKQSVLTHQVFDLTSMLDLQSIFVKLELSHLLNDGGVVMNLRRVDLLLLGELAIILLGGRIVGLLKLSVLVLHLPDLLHVLSLSLFK